MNAALSLPSGENPERTPLLRRTPRDEPRVLPLAFTFALGLHGALAVALPEPTGSRVRPPPLEVELAPPPPVRRPEPESTRPAETTTTKMAPPKVSARAADPQARAPAAAGKLLTTDALPTVEEPLDFVTDPNGSSYGFGVVARGGAEKGEGNARAPVIEATPRETPRSARSLTLGSDLSEKPRLQTPNPCRGYYPASALADSASALVRVVIEADGRVRKAEIASETPTGQGFGLSARHCIAAQRFTSARDTLGRTVPTATTVRVHFER